MSDQSGDRTSSSIVETMLKENRPLISEVSYLPKNSNPCFVYVGNQGNNTENTDTNILLLTQTAEKHKKYLIF